ncbi:MAG: hypothetical protein QF704_13955, partial [Anaerolineales bacterium]|nr:hypothetical protein [Anaerolineales bacterium]
NGLDLAEDLIAILRPLATHGISLVRYIDCVASRVLDQGMPAVVCFCGVIHMADKRMVNACRKRSIPTVGIQHGGSVGTHERSMAEICGVGWCDYYLTYGDGIKASDVSIVPISIVPTRASLIPVGSLVLEKRTSGMRKHKTSYGECVRVLWITDKSYGNTVGHDNRLEDTSRYLLHKRCIEILGKCTGVELTLRPFKSTEEMLGTVRWINSEKKLDVRIDAISSLDDLLTENDLVITDNTASTVWNEAIVFGKPLILFCDPEQTILMHDFIRDLEQSCCWCRTEKELIDAIEKLIREGSEYVRELSQIDTSQYIKKYVLHSDDCRATDRAVRFLLELKPPLVTLPATMESS